VDVYFIAGERSGDRHGAGLMEELRAMAPEVGLHGMGGAEMRGLAPAIRDWVEEAGVVGLVEVLKKYPWFRRQFAATQREILAQNPAAVILIDYPGFNLRMAAALRKKGYAGKLIYYISPQVWAWHRSRIPQMAKLLDLMVCLFPFEKELYDGYGLRTMWAGHPLVQYHRQRATNETREVGLIGFFPGSRQREVWKHFPAMLAAAQQLQVERPALRFIASAASPKLERAMREQLAAQPVARFEIEEGTAHSLMQRASCAAVASGTATLEAAIYGLPHCLIYKVSPLTYLIGKCLIRVPYLGIVNLLAQQELVRELIQGDCTGPKIASVLQSLSDDASARQSLGQQLRVVTDRLAGTDAYRQAAEAILHEIRA
jgi:lipid-A-disaccharide synthase